MVDVVRVSENVEKVFVVAGLAGVVILLNIVPPVMAVSQSMENVVMILLLKLVNVVKAMVNVVEVMVNVVEVMINVIKIRSKYSFSQKSGISICNLICEIGEKKNKFNLYK